MPFAFEALHPSPSHLTSTASSAAGTNASVRTATTTALSSMSDSSHTNSPGADADADDGGVVGLEAVEDDFVNISTEDAHDRIKTNDSGLEQDDKNNMKNVERNGAAAAVARGRGSEDISNYSSASTSPAGILKRAASTDNDCVEDDRKPAAMPTNTNHDQDDDRKPAAKRINSSASMAGSVTTNKDNKDNRFMCSICLETVSDEPVVTRCGHLYCWPCLYQWLQPGMLLSEYRVAFGALPNPNANFAAAANSSSSRSNTTAVGTSGSHGGGLNFLSEMTNSYSSNQHQGNNAAYYGERPYNPAGVRYNEHRRCCPICKAACTVDSVIPIYIHVQSSSSSPKINADDNNQSMDSLDSLDVDNESRPTSTQPVMDTEQSARSASFDGVAGTPRGSPNVYSTNNSASFALDDPTNVNMGLRQRHRGGTSNRPTTRQQQPPFVCDTPTRRNQDILGGFDSMSNQNNTSADGNNNNSMSRHNTPVHRNGSGLPDNETQTPTNVPSRPLPTSPWTSNRSSVQSQPIQNRQQTNTTQPELNDQTTTIPSASPFRVALRPRHRSLTVPSPRQYQHSANMSPSGRPQQQQQHVMPYSQAFASQLRHPRHGRLTSALLTFVDTIDTMATSQHQANGPPEAVPEQPSTPAVPTLHRSDRGMGGIGRASERNQDPQHGSSDGEDLAMSEEESSLAMAREFLSRLLLILACFVILCLLLF